ncbi:GDYXXLXY domain-containing protein [Oscillatoriales cyanobacterium LEGE 11467]|uniref:GDYXXLXY domain-containing protein n=1 Tax=Zarconia navalis LEGE 11467 TaxID=1828826 RepID=A0A928ZA01_9CYAN|nr:GDYXXLXY domain-containing protein [Zarconia navalis]MBE9041261.1 GDYXXLXY domain-containing protein [Zarconia navalis LEGE 11467]
MSNDLTSPAADSPSNSQPKKPLSSWRLWVPLLLQSVLAVSIPLQDAHTYMTGKSIVLQTSAGNSANPMGRDRRELNYEISHPENLRRLPGSKQFFDRHWGRRNFTFYVTLQSPIVRYADSPLPWQPVRIGDERPQHLARNQIALKGQVKGRRILYGLETYYMSEERHQQVNNEVIRVRNLRDRAGGSFVVEVKVDDRGHGVPVSLWVGDRHYRF